ncbi:YbhB/YbcL family Raf kinase inhibitor-like protein [Streptomyces sp. INA 01156]
MTGIDIGSDAFNDHTFIARRHAYEAANVSPPLAWSGVPDDAAELVLLCEDPTRRRGRSCTGSSWASTRTAAVSARGRVRRGAPRWSTATGSAAGRAASAARDDAHHYVFRLYALAEPCVLPDAPRAEQVHEAVDRARIADGTLVGLYRR